MNEKFAGKASSKLAKESYSPVSYNTRKRNLVLGVNTSEIFLGDPKHIAFTAAKHKFVGKMLSGFDKVLEIGCMDGFGSAIVADSVTHLTAIDFFCEHIEQAKKSMAPFLKNVEFIGSDFLDEPVDDMYNGCFALDVLEHIDPKQQSLFLNNVARTLKEHGVFIVGMPSLESQEYASEVNRCSHINCQSSDPLAATLKKYFYNVFTFGMNDEVLHTGYGKMCHYLINVCAGPLKK